MKAVKAVKAAIASVLSIGLLVVIGGTALAHDGVGGDEYASADIMWIFMVAFIVMTSILMFMSWRNGEFNDPEGIKITMLQNAALDDITGEDLEKYALTEA
jgi:hydrogenase/urease accessory protein HupE